MKILPHLLYPLFSLFLLASCGDNNDNSNNGDTAPNHPSNLPRVKVEVVAAAIAPAPHSLEVTGTVQAVQRAVIAARIAADIINIPVEIGDQVEKGALLAELDEGNLLAVVKEAEVATAQAQRNLQRETRLLKKHAATAESVKNLKDTLQISQAKLSQAKEALGYARLHAPFSGVITAKPVNSGDLALPGKPLLSMENPQHFEVVANIPETLIGTIKQGDSVSLTIPSLHRTLKGVVGELSPALNPASRTAAAKISIINEDKAAHLYSGMFATVSLSAQQEAAKAIVIPKKAIQHYGQIEQVFVPQKERAVMRIVRTGESYLQDGIDMVEILSGLDGKEKVLLSTERLHNGQLVEIVNETTKK